MRPPPPTASPPPPHSDETPARSAIVSAGLWLRLWLSASHRRARMQRSAGSRQAAADWRRRRRRRWAAAGAAAGGPGGKLDVVGEGGNSVPGDHELLLGRRGRRGRRGRHRDRVSPAVARKDGRVRLRRLEAQSLFLTTGRGAPPFFFLFFFFPSLPHTRQAQRRRRHRAWPSWYDIHSMKVHAFTLLFFFFFAMPCHAMPYLALPCLPHRRVFCWMEGEGERDQNGYPSGGSG